MVVVADGKLAFSKDRVVSATQASKNFGECRRRAKREPLFVTDRNASIETVIVDYDEFEAMAVELEQLRLQRLLRCRGAAVGGHRSRSLGGDRAVQRDTGRRGL